MDDIGATVPNGFVVINPADGSFVYRPVYVCDYEWNDKDIPDENKTLLAGDKKLAKPKANATTNAQTAPNYSTCEAWYYNSIVEEFTVSGKTYTYTGVIPDDVKKPEPAYSHVRDSKASGYSGYDGTCLTTGWETYKCMVCNSDPGVVIHITDKLPHTYGAYPTNLGTPKASDIDKDLGALQAVRLSTDRKIATVTADCIHPGGEYKYCTGTNNNGAGHWVKQTDVAPTGHALVALTTSGGWKKDGKEKPDDWSFDPNLDYTFEADQICSNVTCPTRGTSEKAIYHYQPGFDHTDSDGTHHFYSAITVSDPKYGPDCKTKATTTYTVNGLKWADDTDITQTYVKGADSIDPDAHKIATGKISWDTTDYESATITGICTVCGKNATAKCDISKTTGEDGITTFVASYGETTDTKKAYTLKGAVVTIDTSNVKDVNLINGWIPGYAPVESEQPKVTVTLNGVEISSDLYNVYWRLDDPIALPKDRILNTAKVLTATVYWKPSVEEKAEEEKIGFVYEAVSHSEHIATTTKSFIDLNNSPEWKWVEHDSKADKDRSHRSLELETPEYSPVVSFSLDADTKAFMKELKALNVTPTIKYAVVPDMKIELTATEIQEIKKKIEVNGGDLDDEKAIALQRKWENSLDFNLDRVEGIKDAGKYYVYVQITADGFTTYTSYLAKLVINKKELYADIDDLTIIEGAEPQFNIEFFKLDDDGNKKVVEVDPSEYTFKSLGGEELTALTPGTYKIQVVSDNYSVKTEKYNSDYVCVLNVITIDDVTPADQAKAKAVGAQIDALGENPTEAEVAAARAAYDKLSDAAKARISPETLKKLTDAEAAIKNKKDAAAAKEEANKAIAAANAYASDATIKALIDALNAALKKGDTAAIKKATADLNNAVAKKKSTPAPKPAAKKASKVKIKTKSKKIKASTIKKKAKKFKVKYSKTGNGKVTFKKVSGSKKLKVSKAGKITIKKGTKKGTYKIKVKATIAATSTYKKATATKTIKVKVTK
jgi:hypothetical protein